MLSGVSLNHTLFASVESVCWAGKKKGRKKQTLGQTLQSGQSFPSISLLNTDVDVILLRTDVSAASKRVTSFVCKGVCWSVSQSPVPLMLIRACCLTEGIEVLHAHAIERRI